MSDQKKENIFKKIVKLFLHIKKFWIFYLIILILVLSLFVLFGVWNPFYKFIKAPGIADTGITIVEIKQIGELVSARYYGEVYCSLMDLTDDVTNFDAERTARQINNVFESTADDALSKIGKWRKKYKNKKMEDFKKYNLPEDDEFLYRKIKRKVKRNYRYRWLIETRRYNMLKEAAGYKKDFDFCLYLYKMKDNENEFEKSHKKSLEIVKIKYKKIILENANISFIGRGWVTAGIDFDSYPQDNIILKDKILYFKDIEVGIIDVDINPWFIPGKVKGFEIVNINREGKITTDHITEVKRQCKVKLLNDAKNAGITERARANARDSIEKLIELLDANDMIDGVVFGDPPEDIGSKK